MTPSYRSYRSRPSGAAWGRFGPSGAEYGRVGLGLSGVGHDWDSANYSKTRPGRVGPSRAGLGRGFFTLRRGPGYKDRPSGAQLNYSKTRPWLQG